MKLKLAMMLALFAALAAMFLTLPGCSTPQDRFNTDSAIWTVAELAAPSVEAAAKLTPAQVAIVNTNLAAGDGNLAAAQTWLAANPGLATTPGYNGPPTLTNFAVFLSALRASLAPTQSVLPTTKP